MIAGSNFFLAVVPTIFVGTVVSTRLAGTFIIVLLKLGMLKQVY